MANEGGDAVGRMMVCESVGGGASWGCKHHGWTHLSYGVVESEEKERQRNGKMDLAVW